MRIFLLLTLLVLTFNAQNANADLEAGKKVFKKCAICHTSDEGGKNKIGPNLWNIVGKPIAEVEGFKYSKAFIAKKDNVIWDEGTLSEFLTSPRKWASKTKMAFPGLKKQEDRDNLIEYLATFK